MLSSYKKINKDIDKYIQKIALKVEDRAKKLVPVDSGDLKDSIKVVKEQDNARLIGSNLIYAKMIELGAYKRPAQPYLRPALRQ